MKYFQTGTLRFTFTAIMAVLINGTSSPAKVFLAKPGTNTLMMVRDVVRAWRSSGHPDEPAVIQLARGNYRITEPLHLNRQDGNTTWEARDPDQTLVSGGQPIGPFTADAAGIWHAHTALAFEQLYVNDRRSTRAEAPEEDFFHILEVHQVENLSEGKSRITIQVSPAAVAGLPTEPGALHQVQILVFHKWDTSRYALESFDAVAATITVTGERMKPWNSWNQQSRFRLENSSRWLTRAGNWFLDRSGNLSYRPLAGENITQTKVIAPRVEQLMVIEGATGLHFKGLRIHHAGYRMPAGGCPPTQAAAMIGAAIEIDEARDVTFENAEIAHTGNYGIWFRQGCHACRIQHCLLEDLGAGGIRIGETKLRDETAEQTDEILADNNIIRSGGRVHPSAVGVWIGQSANNRITHNDISDLYYTGVSVGWTWGYGRSLATNNFIGFNRIHQIGQGRLSDMGGIYTLGVSPGSRETGNVIYDVRAHDYGGWGIYPDEGSSGWQIESNLVWNCTCINPRTGGAFHQHYGENNRIANNIFALSSGPPMQVTRVESHRSLTLEHNLIISSAGNFFTGPWDKLQFESRSNVFAGYGKVRPGFPKGELAAWQDAGHEAGSRVMGLSFQGEWPDVAVDRHSPALAMGFVSFDPKIAGVYGGRAWKRIAKDKR